MQASTEGAVVKVHAAVLPQIKCWVKPGLAWKPRDLLSHLPRSGITNS